MNAIKKLIGILLALLCVMCAACTACADAPSEILINQFEQNADEVTIYLNMMDANGLSSAGEYTAADFVVNISGSQDFVPDSAATVVGSGTPVLYALGFDIGKSELADVRDAVNDLIMNKKPQDRVMLVKLGDELNYIQQPTQDAAQLQNALGQLDQHCTSTYQGIRQFMVDTANARQPGERVAIVLFTDGLDNNSGSDNEWETLNTITQIRLPVYTIGLKNTSSSDKFGYYERMAAYSLTRVFTEKDGNAMSSLQAIRKLCDDTVALRLRLPYHYFQNPTLTMWKASYTAGGQTITSSACSYTLSSDVPEPTATPDPATPTPSPSVDDGDDESEKKIDIDFKALLKRKEVQIVLIGMGGLLVLIIVIITIVKLSSRKHEHYEPTPSMGHEFSNKNLIVNIPVIEPAPQDDVSQIVVSEDEKTINPYQESQEATINPFADEGTLPPVFDPPVRIRFDVDTREEPPFMKEITFADHMLIGRHKTDCQLYLAPGYISRKQFRLSKTDQGVFIYNLNPEKAAEHKHVLLNGVLLLDKEQKLNDGDLLVIGKTQVRIHILSDEE